MSENTSERWQIAGSMVATIFGIFAFIYLLNGAGTRAFIIALVCTVFAAIGMVMTFMYGRSVGSRGQPSTDRTDTLTPDDVAAAVIRALESTTRVYDPGDISQRLTALQATVAELVKMVSILVHQSK